MSAPRMATCYDDDEPLVMTFEMDGKEFVCVVCGRWYEFFEPKAASPTPELQARHDELKAKYDAARAERSIRRA